MGRVYLWHNQNRIQNGLNNYAMVRSKLWCVRFSVSSFLPSRYMAVMFSWISPASQSILLSASSFHVEFCYGLLQRKHMIQVQSPQVDWKPKLLMVVSEIWYPMTFWMKFGKDCRIWINVLGSDVKDGSLSVWFSSSSLTLSSSTKKDSSESAFVVYSANYFYPFFWQNILNFLLPYSQ